MGSDSVMVGGCRVTACEPGRRDVHFPHTFPHPLPFPHTSLPQNIRMLWLKVLRMTALERRAEWGCEGGGRARGGGRPLPTPAEMAVLVLCLPSRAYHTLCSQHMFWRAYLTEEGFLAACCLPPATSCGRRGGGGGRRMICVIGGAGGMRSGQAGAQRRAVFL